MMDRAGALGSQQAVIDRLVANGILK